MKLRIVRSIPKKSGVKSRKQRRRQTKRRRPTRPMELIWQVIGMITIMIILITLFAGKDARAASWVSDSIFSKTFSEAVASFAVR